jgi:hypothetical protein
MIVRSERVRFAVDTPARTRKAEVLAIPRPSWHGSGVPLVGLAGSFSPGPLVSQGGDPGGECVKAG